MLVLNVSLKLNSTGHTLYQMNVGSSATTSSPVALLTENETQPIVRNPSHGVEQLLVLQIGLTCNIPRFRGDFND